MSEPTNELPKVIPTAEVMRLSKITAASFGTTRKALEVRIERGIWLEGKEYHRAPDGTIWLNTKGVTRWVVGDRA